MRLSLNGLLRTACLLLVVPSAATADPLYATRLTSDLSARSAEGGYDTGLIPNSDDAGPLSDTISDLGNTATSTTSVLDATLHAFVSATSAGSFYSNGNAEAYFYDTFFLEPGTVPVGT